MNQLPFLVAQTGIPVILISGAGRAKTALIEQFSYEMKRNFYPVYLNSRDREDVGGYPRYDEETKTIRYILDESLDIKEPALMFFDELNTAPEHVRVVAQRIINEKYLGNRKLGDVWFFIAGNPPGVSANSVPFDPAIVNRCAVFNWSSPVEWWSSFMVASGKNFLLNKISGDNDSRSLWRPVFPKVNRKKFEEELEKYIPVSVTFVKNHSNIVEEPDKSEPYCSIRSITNAVSALCAVKAATDLQMNEKDALSLVVTSCVGEKAADKFLKYIEALDIPDPIEVMEGKVPLPKRHDIIYIVVTALASKIKDTKMANKVLEFYAELYSKHADLVFFGLSLVKDQIVHLKLPPSNINVPNVLRKEFASIK